MVRFTFCSALDPCLAACRHGVQNNNEAVRQGVIDHLTQAKYNVAGMDVTVSQVQFNGNEADATVSVTVKGQSGGMPMGFKYHLQQQNGKWVVVGRDTGSTAHGGGAMPESDRRAESAWRRRHARSHAARRIRTAAAQMPSPEDLPPVQKK